MKRGGATDRDITSVSGHNEESSLKHYDPYVTDDKAAKMANDIANAGLERPGCSTKSMPPPEAPNPGLTKPPPKAHNPAVVLHDEFFNSQDPVSSYSMCNFF